LSPVVFGIAMYLAIGSLAAGATSTPSPLAPAGVVAGAIDPAPTIEMGVETVEPPTRRTIVLGASIPVADDLRDLREARLDAPPLATLTGYRWPLPKGRLTQQFGPTRFGSRVVDGKPFHDGIDLATFCGDRIVAAHDGVVLAASRHYDDAIGWLGDLTAYYRRLDAKKLWATLPIVVVIDDGNGYRSMYAHFEKVVVKRGQRVHAGDLLGYEGRTGNASGCHLHYGLFSPSERGATAIDPGVAGRMKLPRAEIARVDPLLVLPGRALPTTSVDTGER
jgi:murein DD-endopeptidase MepM/ murein hydrolase activator NlpD